MEEKNEPEIDWGQDANGVDIAAIRYNLSLTPLERLEQHTRAVENILALKDAAKRAQSRKAS